MRAGNILNRCIMTLIFMFMLISLLSCSRGNPQGDNEASSTEAVSDSNTANKKNHDDNSERDKNYLTSIEAVQLAYEEAKEWSEDALFMSITIGSQLSLHYAWTETDMAYHWTVDFVSPEKKQMIFIYMNYGRVYDTLVNEYNMKNMPVAGHPDDRPLISLKEANSIAVLNEGIYGLMPVNARYETCGYLDNDFPYWCIVYRVPTPDDGEERNFYYINAKTGELADTVYHDDSNDEIEKEKLKVGGQDLSGYALMEDQRYTVIKFFTLINEGRTDEAAEMMDEFMAPDNNTKKMWIESLSSITGHEYTSGGFVTEDEENWTEDTRRFEIRIVIPESCDCEKYGWSKGLTKRWITLKRYDNIWKIHELATSP